MTKLALLAALLATACANAARGADLWVGTTPQTPEPYALKKGRGIKLGGDTYPVTGNSSGGAFCILNTNAAGSSSSSGSGPGLFPHVHKKTYENFYASKGRVQLWGQNLAAYRANTSVQQTRILYEGDIGAIPPGTIHTFTLLEPDTELTGVLVPGGFEEFFFHMSEQAGGNGTTLPGAGGFDVGGLARWDVYPQLDFAPRRDAVDGRAGGPGAWHDGANALPPDASAPIWVAKNHGPLYLNAEHGRYQIVAPLVTGRQTNDTFSQGTITLSPPSAPRNGTASAAPPILKYSVATAFLMQEGQLQVTVDGYEPASLIDGDLVFVPANASFSYTATAEFTKFMYVTGGGGGANSSLDAQLIASGQPWSSAFYPQAQAQAQVGTAMPSVGRLWRI